MKRAVHRCIFDSILLDALDETLLTLGKETKAAMYKYFKEVLNIPKREIPRRIEEFSRGLEELFGDGSRNLEILIMMKLHSKIGVVWEYPASNRWLLPELTFNDYICRAKKYFRESEKYEDKISIFVDEKKARMIYK